MLYLSEIEVRVGSAEPPSKNISLHKRVMIWRAEFIAYRELHDAK